MNEDELLIDLDAEIGELPSDVYLVEVDSVEYKMSQKGDPYIVIAMHIADGPYEGETFQQWIGQSPELRLGIKKMNQKTLKDFIKSCLDGEDFEGPLRFTDSADGTKKVAEEFNGMQLGAYLGTRNDNINLERGGFIPARLIDSADSDEDPFS